MHAKAKLTAVSGPRPYLTIVKALKLDSVHVDAATKTKLKTSKGHTPLAVLAANDGTIPESGRNNTLTSLGGAMRRKGMSKESIDAALQNENLTRCVPPLDPSEVSAIAASMVRYTPAEATELLTTLTDTGNATRFGLAYAGNAIYVPGQGWLLWDGLQWQRDSLSRVMELSKKLMRSIYLEGVALTDDKARIAVAAHGQRSQAAARLKATLELAESLPELATQANDLDRHDMLLGVANGVLNLKTGKLQAARPEDRITRHSSVLFDKEAACPIFLEFLAQITGGDKELITYLQRVVGYSLTGLTSEQCLFFLYGSGANGKSTFLNVLKELLGPDLARQTPAETLMARKNIGATNDIARLQGVRAVIANEVEDGSPLAESLVKQMTGGEAMTARFLYGEFTEFYPKFKLFIAGNHKPTIRGRDDGIWRRMRLIPFVVTVPEAQRDKHLQQKLRAELPGILNWAIKGCMAWQKSGLKEPKTVTQAVASYREEMDLLGAWIGDKAEQTETATWKVRQAYGDYSQWAMDGGYKAMSESVFSRELEGKFNKVRRKDANYFVGIGPKTVVVMT